MRKINKVLKLPQVISSTSLSKSTIYQLMGEDAFPKSFPLGSRGIGWLESDVQNWISDRVKASTEEA